MGAFLRMAPKATHFLYVPCTYLLTDVIEFFHCEKHVPSVVEAVSIFREGIRTG
jgi:hypothetical protein